MNDNSEVDESPVTKHEELLSDLPDYSAGRLAPERRAVVEAHLAGCPDCRVAVADLMAISAGLKTGGDAIFEPHPEPEALRRMLLGGGAGEGALVERHVASCASCALEVEAWRRRDPHVGTTRDTTRAATPTRPDRQHLALAAACGVAAGVLIVTGLRLGRPAAPPMSPPSTPVAGDASQAIGQPVLYVLPETFRDDRATRRRWVLDPDDPYFAIAFPILIPESVEGGAVYRVALRRIGDGVVWSAEMTAARLREHMNAADAVHLPAILTALVPAGTYEVAVLPTGVDDAPPLYRAEVEITYRQSPTATKAPQ